MSLANLCQELRLKTNADAFISELRRYSYHNWVPGTWQAASVKQVRFLDGHPTWGEDDVYGVFFHKTESINGQLRPLPLPDDPVPVVTLMVSDVGGEYPLLVKILPRSETGVRFAEEFMTRCRKLWDTPDAHLQSSQPEATLSRKYLPQLLKILDERFNEGELKTLCFRLAADYDNLPDEGKANKARELILYLENRNRISDLIKSGKEQRPDIEWPEVVDDD